MDKKPSNNNLVLPLIAVGIILIILLILVGILYSKVEKKVCNNSQDKFIKLMHNKIPTETTSVDATVSKQNNGNNVEAQSNNDKVTSNEINLSFGTLTSHTSFFKQNNQEYAVNDLIEEQDSEEDEKPKPEELENIFKANTVHVYIGRFRQKNAVQLMNYLKFLKFPVSLRIVNNQYFIIAEFKKLSDAQQFLNWAAKNNLADAKIIPKN